MAKEDPFRVLSDTEFQALTLPEKSAYLKAGIEAQKRLTNQMVEAMREMLKQPPGDLDDLK